MSLLWSRERRKSDGRRWGRRVGGWGSAEGSDFEYVVDCLLLSLLQLLDDSLHVAVLSHLQTISTCDVLQTGIGSQAHQRLYTSSVSFLRGHVQRGRQVEVCAVDVGACFLQHDQRPVDVVGRAKLRVGVDHHPMHWTEASLHVCGVHVGPPRDERLHHLVPSVRRRVVQH